MKHLTFGVGLEQSLFLGDVQVEHRTQEVSEPHRVVGLNYDVPNLRRNVWKQAQRFLNQDLNVPLKRFNLRGLLAHGLR